MNPAQFIIAERPISILDLTIRSVKDCDEHAGKVAARIAKTEQGLLAGAMTLDLIGVRMLKNRIEGDRDLLAAIERKRKKMKEAEDVGK